jgi:hypothetical protein
VKKEDSQLNKRQHVDSIQVDIIIEMAKAAFTVSKKKVYRKTKKR